MSESVITIKFARGLLGDEFTAKNGNELVRVKIPNEDPEDRSPWASFVVPAGSVYDSQNGKQASWCRPVLSMTVRTARQYAWIFRLTVKPQSQNPTEPVPVRMGEVSGRTPVPPSATIS